MRSSGLHFLPLVLPLFLAFVLLVGLLILLIEINLLGYAYEKVGMHHRYMITLLVLSLMGSYVNIPIAELPTQHVLSGGEVITLSGGTTMPVSVFLSLRKARKASFSAV